MAEWFNDVKLSKKAYVPDPEPLQEVQPSYGNVEGGSPCHSSVFLPSPFVLSLLVLFLPPFTPFIAPFLSSHLLPSYYSFAPPTLFPRTKQSGVERARPGERERARVGH